MTPSLTETRDPLTLQLPNWVDTNREYRIWWNHITEVWEVIPF